MKPLWITTFCVLCFLYRTDFAFAQQDSTRRPKSPPKGSNVSPSTVDDQAIQIDPRQYVKVLYRKSASDRRLIPIWNWEDNQNIPNQKVELLDVNGAVKIQFSTLGIIKNYDFEGTVSLEAEISGANGTRKIEVNPYSEIGVQRVPIGIKSEPPSEIAKKLLNMLRAIKDADTIYHQLIKANIVHIEDNNQKVSIKLKLDSLSNYIKNPRFDTKAAKNKLFDFFRSSHYTDATNYNDLVDSTINRERLKEDIKESIDNYKGFQDDDKKAYQNLYKKALAFDQAKIDLILKYLASFEGGGSDATKAFLSLLNKDEIGYAALKNNFLDEKKQLAAIDINDDSKIDTVLLKHSKFIMDATKSLTELSDFEASPFEEILVNLRDSLNKRSASNNSGSVPNNINQYGQILSKKDLYFEFIDKNLDTLSKRLSIAAGKIIYKKLIYATVDLGKSGAKNGEVLNIYLTWIQDSKKDSLDNSPRLPLGKYLLAETGWKVEIADMFSLVKRIHEPTDDPNLSPSNFKGTGGAVLMWTYHKQDDGLIIKSNDGNVSVKRTNQLINFLEPSFGINVSALDFSTTKDVEIGTGLQMGLFSNKIFFGYGVNLHMISPAHQSPGYFFIGFSFAKVADLFKSSPSISSSQ